MKAKSPKGKKKEAIETPPPPTPNWNNHAKTDELLKRVRELADEPKKPDVDIAEKARLTKSDLFESAAKRYQPIIDTVSKSGILLLGLCYGMGLIVVNIHFARFGFFSVSLFRVSYIFAGAWALIVLIFTSCYYLGQEYLFHSTKKHGLNLTVRIIVSVVVTAVYIEILYGFYIILLRINADELSILGISGLFFSSLVLLFAFRGYVHRLLGPLFTDKDETRTPGSMDVLWKSNFYSFGYLLQFMTLLFYLSAFGIGLYPHMSAEFGGGKPKRIILVSDKATASVLSLANVQVHEVNKKFSGTDSIMTYFTDPLQLLFEGEGHLVVLSNGSDSASAIELDAGIVSAIIHISRNIKTMGNPILLTELESVKVKKTRSLSLLEEMKKNNVPADSLAKFKKEWVDPLDVRIAEIEKELNETK